MSHVSHLEEHRPVILIVEDDDQVRVAALDDIGRRFGADYDLVDFSTASEALDWLESESARERNVAVMLAALALPGQQGADFLETAHQLQKAAQRGLFVSAQPNSLQIEGREELQRATLLGQVDFYVVTGWVNPEESLYPLMQEAISAWSNVTEPGFELLEVVGDQWSPRTHDLREGLARNVVPFGSYDVDTVAGQELLDEHNATELELPVAIVGNDTVLSNPTAMEVAQTLGVRTHPKRAHYDVVILGAGPAGLAATVSSLSEGLGTLLVEPMHLGGQAGSSPIIRNYLGFPRGVSGEELTRRAFDQAWLFGAELLFLQRATGLAPKDHEIEVNFSDCDPVRASTVVVATGVESRRLGIPSVERLVGRGVYYGAPGIQAPVMSDEHVFVVGGGNSAAQAALHLAQFAASVTMLVRGSTLEDSTSSYLTVELEATENMTIRTQAQVVEATGSNRLQGLTIESTPSGRRDEVDAAGLFILIGAETQTEWLRGTLALDDRGYILTGHDVSPASRSRSRAPLPFESSMPNVFAVGDVRNDSSKRVAAAAGEGSVAIGSVRQYLADMRAS